MSERRHAGSLTAAGADVLPDSGWGRESGSRGAVAGSRAAAGRSRAACRPRAARGATSGAGWPRPIGLPRASRDAGRLARGALSEAPSRRGVAAGRLGSLARRGRGGAGPGVPGGAGSGEAARPASELSTVLAAASRGAGTNNTRLPSRTRFSRPAPARACRWRVVHDCESPTARASWLTLCRTPESSSSIRSKRRGGASAASGAWSLEGRKCIAWRCIPLRGD